MGETPPTRTAEIAVFADRGGRVFSVGDVIAAAHFRGELDKPWQRLLERQAADEAAEERDLEMDDDAVQALSDDFRSDRDLITAEETERWLEARGLTLDDFNDYFIRQYWGNVAGSRTHAEGVDYAEAPEDLRDLLTAEVLLSGEFDRMATGLSWRVVAKLAAGDTPIDGEILARERKAFLERTHLDEEGVGEWLEQMGLDEKWLDETLALEAAYAQARSTLVTEQLCRSELSAVRLQYAQIDLELVEVESYHAAREAMMCVRTDGLSLSEVAHESAYPHHRAVMLLEDLPAEIHERVLCAAPGDLLEPLPHGDGFQVCRIHGKSEATLEDPDIRRRIENRLLGQAFADLCSQHIRWELSLPPNP